MLFQSLQLCGVRDTLGLLEGLDCWLRLDVDGIVEGGEALLVGVVQKSALLEEEREVVLAINLDAGQPGWSDTKWDVLRRKTHLLSDELADVRYTGVRDRNDLDQFGLFKR